MRRGLTMAMPIKSNRITAAVLEVRLSPPEKGCTMSWSDATPRSNPAGAQFSQSFVIRQAARLFGIFTYHGRINMTVRNRHPVRFSFASFPGAIERYATMANHG